MISSFGLSYWKDFVQIGEFSEVKCPLVLPLLHVSDCSMIQYLRNIHTFYLRILKKDENIENEILQYFSVL